MTKKKTDKIVDKKQLENVKKENVKKKSVEHIGETNKQEQKKPLKVNVKEQPNKVVAPKQETVIKPIQTRSRHVAYAIGFADGDYYGLSEGPFQDLQDALNEIPERDDSYILQLTAKQELDKPIYVWSSQKNRWLPMIKRR